MFTVFILVCRSAIAINSLFPFQLRVHVKVLKKGVLDEQAKSNELRELLKEKEKNLRKGELEIDSLTFRNQQLTRRVSVLQDELDNLQASFTLDIKSNLVITDLGANLMTSKSL